MESILSTLAQNIRNRRKKLGLSQEKLAEMASLHRTYVGAIERGERNISLRSLEKIAVALEVSPAELITKSRRIK